MNPVAQRSCGELVVVVTAQLPIRLRILRDPGLARLRFGSRPGQYLHWEIDRNGLDILADFIDNARAELDKAPSPRTGGDR